MAFAQQLHINYSAMLGWLPGSQTAPILLGQKDNHYAPFSTLDVSLSGLVRPCFVRSKCRSTAGGVLPCSFVDGCERHDLHQIRPGHAANTLKVSIATHMHIKENSQDALNAFYPYYAGYFFTHTPSHWRAVEVTRADYDERAAPHGAIFVGSPQQIIDKILYERELFGHQRFLAQIDIGGLPFLEVARVIELFATKVAPVIRGAVGR